MARILSQEEIDAQFGGGFRADVAPAGQGTRLGASFDRFQAGALGIGESMGLPLGDLRRENQFESEQSRQRFFRDNPNEPQSFRDVEDVGSALRYIRGLAIDSAPELITSLATGGAGALMGLNTAGRIGLAAAANYPSAVGDILQNQRQEAGQTNFGTAALLGVPYAAADLVGLDAALASGKMMRTGIKRLDEMRGFGGAAARTGANVAMNAPIEGASETFQELVNQAGRIAVNPNQTFFNPEANERYLESFVGGAALGGAASGLMGGWRRSEQYQAPEQETDLLNKQTQQPAPQQYGLVTQPAPLQQRIDQQLGIGARTTPKDYAKQFEEAYNEPSGQYATDPVTGLEKQLSVGEYQQMTNAPLDLTEAKPADAAAAAATTAKIERDPKDLFIRDTLKVIPNQHSRTLFDMMMESGIDPQADLMVPVWNYAAEKYMSKGRYDKAVQMMDEAIIKARQGAPSGTGVSTVQQPAGGVGVGGAVVPGTVGTAGSNAPVTGTVGGDTTAAGAASQQAGVLPSASGQPSTTVTTTPVDLTATTPSKFRRAPKPMTVLEAAEAAKAAQAQQTGAPAAPPQPVVDERQVVLQQIFGERNGDIIFDVVGMGMSEPEAAAKYNTSRQNIQKIAGATGQKTWPARIAKAKAEKGLTDEQIADAFNVPTADSVENQIASQVFTQGQERMDEGQAIEAGLENIVKTAGAGTSEVEGFTKLQKEIDATLEALASETDEATLEELNKKLAEQLVKVRAVEEQAKAEVRATAGRKSKKDEADEAAVQAETAKPVGEEDAVQVQSTAVVPVQSEAQTGKGVGGQVRRAEKPAGKGQTQGQAKGQVDRGRALWESLSAKTPGLVPYEQLTKLEQDYLTDLAVRTNGKPVVAKEMGLQQLLTKEPTTIDVEARVIDEQVTTQVAALPAPQIDRLEKHYGNKRDSAEFLRKVQEDITKYVTQGAEAVAGAIRSIIKAMAEGVLAMGIVFNPNITKDAFNINVGKTFQQTIEVTQEVPAAAKAQMSPTAQTVYSAMAPVAMKSGKWFMVADKPNGMLHIFKEDGSHALSDPTLYGKDTGDVLDAVSSLEGGPKITPAGKFTLKARASTYAGGQELILVESKDYTGYIVVHAADTSTPSENRLGRLDTPTAADNRVSYGCINTKHDTFINEIKPNISKLDGGMVFVVPDAQDQVAQMFAAETRTETRTEGGEGAKGVAAAQVVGKEENMLFGKDQVAKNPYTAEKLLDEIKAFIRADIPGRKLLVVDSIEDLLNSKDPQARQAGLDIQEAGAYGGAEDGRSYLVANRINRGSGRAKFMHEVGAHLGIERLLSKEQFDTLFEQIRAWYIKADGSLEAELAISAVERVNAAGTIEKHRRAETIAYFIENAMQMGVDPTAANEKLVGPLRTWFRTLWAAFKIAVRKLGFKPESLTAQDVVNLAYGAARLEINGTFHGTAASFRNFLNKYIGTGEGATAYGWGTYLAQRAGIAKGYWKSDIERKESKQTVEFDGLPLDQALQKATEVLRDPNKTNDDITDEEVAKINALQRMSKFVRENAGSPQPQLYALIALQDSMNLSKPGSRAHDEATQAFNWAMENSRKFRTVQANKPAGNLMRVDIAVEDKELYDYDKPVSKQSREVKEVLQDLLEPLNDDIIDMTNKDWDELTGQDLIGTGEDDLGLLSRLIMDDYISMSGGKQYDAAVQQGQFHKAASLLLDHLGVRGIKFFDARSRGSATAFIAYEGKKYSRDKLRDLAGETYKSGDVLANRKFLLLRELIRMPVNLLKQELELKIKDQIQAAIETYKDTDRRFGSPISEAEMRASAERAASMSYEAWKLKWLNENESKIYRGEYEKTQNVIIFDDKNVQRVGSAVNADRQQMKFGGQRFEGLPDKKNPVLDEKVTRGNTNIDKAIRLLTRASKEKDAAAADALRAEAQKLFDSAASKMKFGKEVPAPTQGAIQRTIATLPKAAQQPVRLSLGAMGDAVNKGLDYVVFTSDLVNRATASGIGSAKKFVDLVGKSKSEARENEIAVEKISDMYALVPEKDRGTGEGSVNRFLFDSTREGKWGYGKYRNDDMGARFDALSPESQAYVEAVFAHGSDMLAKKKKLVLDSTNSEYDAMIAAAKADGDTAAEVRLTKEKEATLKRFQTLFRLRDGIPYAPIKRNGSHVVIAKSKEYLAAEAANDKKRITELESNSDHYHVSFTDGKWEARTLQQELNDQGFFDDVQVAERDTVIDEMFSGHSALRELTKMRSRVDAQAKDGDKSSSKMLSLISQMYLEALAEGSARKSEMRRRGVAGEVDMIRSFAQQGRADANFMASVKYNPQIQDALQEMRNQVKKGDRERKSEIFNELAKRYVQSLDYSPTPWLNKLTRMSSIYYLATSPAYYLQNLTQPWMMSVPAMAGKYNYVQASNALFKAYTELGGVMKSAKLLKQQFDFDKVPADVRDAIKELVNRGKIDIGLDTEMGEFKVEGDNYFAGKISAADKALRLAVQKVESINRLSTAMAAYRLELAKNGSKEDAINYADRILTETHGDYTSFNAPRAFNTGVGKVALQFRKFQLIQLSFYAKLIKDALSGADRAAALKTLAYSLGHTGLLAGAMGLPGYSAIAWAINALLSDEDDKYDLTNELRKAIGDEQVANLILRGAPTLVGADISGKVGAGNMLSIMPFSQADLTTTAGRFEAFGTLIGGAAGGMTSRMIDGLLLMSSGDWYRGLEMTMPKGVSDAMKAYRVANEGMTRRNGDIILPPDEVSALDTLFQAIGVQPVEQTVTYERQNLMKATTQNFTERTTRIKNDYVKAARAGDTEGQAEAREAWKKLQDVKRREGVNVSPLSDLLKAPAEQRKREKMTVGGVQYTKGTRKLAEEIAGD